MSALEASDRYLSRHRPDLFYDQQNNRGETNTSSNTYEVFGRTYEIPSNPFEYIYNGYFQNPQQQQQTNGENGSSPGSITSPTYSLDLGRSAHFPFGSPNGTSVSVGSTGAFTGRSASIGGGSTSSNGAFTGRSTSMGSTGNNSHGHFAPINNNNNNNNNTKNQNQNLAAGRNDYDVNDIAAAAGFASYDVSGGGGGGGGGAHTGHSWQQQQHHHHQSEGNGGIIGNIWRNLPMSSWYNNANNDANNFNNSQNTNMNNNDPNNNYGGEEEIYYDDYNHQHNDPSLFNREIEMEPLPNDETDDEDDYNFAFQDFPRKDGTPCLIINDDSLLHERKRRESARKIFTIDDEEDKTTDDASLGSLTEKKQDDARPVSDDVFKKMLSQNSQTIDGSSFEDVASGDGNDDDDDDVPGPLDGSFLTSVPNNAKSPELSLIHI